MLIVGCSSGGSSDHTKPATPVAPIVAEGPSEIADPVPLAVDAGTPAAPVDARTSPPDRNNPKDLPRFDPCKAPPDPRNIPCNPPSVGYQEARIIEQKVDGGDLLITINRGENTGIGTADRVELVGPTGKAIKAVTRIESVERMRARVRISNRTDLPRNTVARLFLR